MASITSIPSHLKWLVLLAPMAGAATDVSRCTWTVAWSGNDSLRAGPREICEGLTIGQVVGVSLAITIGLLLLAGILALLYRLNRNRNQLQLTQFSSAAWPITRATHRPVFQPPGTPAPEFVHDLKFPQKAMYHI
ncbi:uncharacterized protein PGTG_02383 [Puccinia graminis f. sp. tritici CRL 75-36-700-3]|uniref:Uncharacterized protein n=1 Tax=Puccinia graminis f. sp. tritici (strain CRL 75-36-700-3 / race SCCL) TaxID=418459 RepID=E3JXZ7_PUCGT|nr:uncharacterized protein PGTG_02383 [Puccinia graminis f. sp. tritici CRL 75-36-700-3]EFP76922.2 hypothetical protein PGTG_02383 [Puccinia graminis f. sp. tritici CRL 75-36-700-3]